MLKSLSDCLSLVIDRRGVTPKKLNSSWKEKGYRVLSANNVKTSGLTKIEEIRCIDETTYKKWMKNEICRGDILLTSEAPAGEVLYWDSDEKIVAGQRIYVLRTKKEINPLFLKYYLQSETGQTEIKNKCSGSTVFGISEKTFDFINVVLPEKKDTQDKIANILKTIDDRININNKINNELNGILSTMYGYYILQKNIPSKYKNTEKINWKNYQLKDIFSYEKGRIPEKVFSNKSAEMIPYLTIEAVSDGEIQYCKKNNMVVSNGEVIMVMDGAASGDIYVGNYGALGSTFSQLKVKNKNISNNLLYYILKPLVKGYKVANTGSTVPHANKEFINNLTIELPDDSILKKISSEFDKVYEQIRINNLENQELIYLKGYLIPMLMNGQIKIED